MGGCAGRVHTGDASIGVAPPASGNAFVGGPPAAGVVGPPAAGIAAEPAAAGAAFTGGTTTGGPLGGGGMTKGTFAC